MKKIESKKKKVCDKHNEKVICYVGWEVVLCR